MHPSVTQEYLRSIVTYDPTTTKLVPVNPQPRLGITAAKFGQRHLLIGCVKVSMSKLAYLYHHGEMPAMVTHLDGNNTNFAPDNLVPYKPSGRAKNLPIPDAIDHWQNAGSDRMLGACFRAVLRPPAGCQGKTIVLTDGMGYPVTAKTRKNAMRLAATYAKNLTNEQKQTLGMLPQQDVANIDK